jgi:hypothetical protein
MVQFIAVDHRPKLFLEGFPVEAWIGALEREGSNPGSHGLGETTLHLFYPNLARDEVAPW